MSSGFSISPGLLPPRNIHPPQANGAPHDRIDLNPQVYLNLSSATNQSASTGTCSKYRANVDYIPPNARTSDEDIEIATGVFLKVNPNTAKVRIENVTQWVVANCCILGDIIVTWGGGVDIYNMVLDYMSYSAKNGELATRFTWSVIKYDDDYRSKQHRFGFRWGSDLSHMITVVLEERP